jgi:sugar phosphate isomerase/epimerase
MPQHFSLAYLTVSELAPPDAVTVASQTGYDYLGLRLLPAAPGGAASPLMEDPGLLRATKTRIAEMGVGVFDLEIIRLNARFKASNFLRFFEVGAELGAKAILVAGDDPDSSRLMASFASLCEAAAPFNLSCDLEFMPWTQVPNARSAMRIIEEAGHQNGGILVDALHFARSESSLEDIATIPRERMNYAQICDAPGEIPTTVEGLIHTARCERLLPGDGGINLVSLFAALPSDLPVSVEVPNEKQAPAVGPLEWARQALAKTKATLDRIDRQGVAE